jgi:hypothetical protein
MDESPQQTEPVESGEPETALETEVIRLVVLTLVVMMLLFVLFSLAWDPSLLNGAGFGGAP